MTIREAVLTMQRFIDSGPSRMDQLECDVREIYRRFGFNLQRDTPQRVLESLLEEELNLTSRQCEFCLELEAECCCDVVCQTCNYGLAECQCADIEDGSMCIGGCGQPVEFCTCES